MTNRTTDPRQCPDHSWCGLGTKFSDEEHDDYHAGDLVDLVNLGRATRRTGGPGWWAWLSEDRTGANAGVPMVSIEGRNDGEAERSVTLPAADLGVILSATVPNGSWLQLAGMVEAATGPSDPRLPDPDFVCPRFKWCTYGRENRAEHDDHGVHAGDHIQLNGYGENADGDHDRGFLGYLAHDDSDSDPWLVVWGFSDEGNFLDDIVPARGLMMLLGGVKDEDQLELLRRGVTSVPVWDQS